MRTILSSTSELISSLRRVRSSFPPLYRRLELFVRRFQAHPSLRFSSSIETDTRRQAATEFTRALMEQFETEVTAIVKRYIDAYLGVSSSFLQHEGRAKRRTDASIFSFPSVFISNTPPTLSTTGRARILLSISSPLSLPGELHFRFVRCFRSNARTRDRADLRASRFGSRSLQHGVTSTNVLVDVVEFFSQNVFQDLQGAEGTVNLFLLVDAIKFLHTFRNQVRTSLRPIFLLVSTLRVELTRTLFV